MSNRVSVIRHNPHDGFGRLRKALESFHLSPDSHSLYHDPEAIPNLSDSLGLIVLGGEQSVNSRLAFLEREKSLVEEALQLEIPVLGICLGAQVLASVLGAKVERMGRPETGWHAVRCGEAAEGDLLFAGWGEQTVFHWHNECFDLPAGAEALASSASCAVQAFRYGETAWGMQFHLEVEPADIARWVREDAECGAERECRETVDPFYGEEALRELARRVFGRWAELAARGGVL